MTNSTATAPVVKTAHPELYANHTFHMSKARKYTYNYAVIDEVINELWGEMTMAEIAKVLKDLGVIEGKYNMERGKLMRMRKILITFLDDVDSQLKKTG
jgi:crotonobetainyl-CoA:carnitine CoA-transferase CaiB-like acyl-CoA transferase